MPIARFEMPNGKIGRFEVPEGTTPEQAQTLIQQHVDGSSALKKSTKPQTKGFAGRVGDDLEHRNDQLQEIDQARKSGEQGRIESGFQKAGVGAGIALDVAGEGIISLGRGISNITPDIIEAPIKKTIGDLVGGAVNAVGSLPAFDGGTLGENLPKELSALSAQHPRATRNISAATNIAMLAAPVKGKPKVLTANPSSLNRIADTVNDAAIKQQTKKKTDFAQTLILPKQTAKIKAEQVARTQEGGILKSKILNLDPAQQNMANQVSKLTIDSKKSIQYNYNLIQKEVFSEGESLKNALAKHDVIFPRKEFNVRLNDVKDRLRESPNIVGDSAVTADRILAKFERILDDNPSTGSGLLAARKDLDAWIRKEKPRAFDGNKEGAFEIALRDIRNVTNGFIDEKATNVAVKDSLSKQSSLYGALDNIAPKAAKEGNNLIKRHWQSVTSFIPIKGEAFQALAAVGLAGAASSSAPALLPAAIGVYVVGKTGQMVLSPAAKKGLSVLIGKTDEALRLAKDKDIIRKMRLDRAAIVELLKE